MKRPVMIYAAVVTLVQLASLGALSAEPLKSATVTERKNDVRVQLPDQERPAQVSDVLEGNKALLTGPKSLAELEFNDQSITRVGANSIFSFDPDQKAWNLKSGFMLLQVPKGQGGGRINTPRVTAAITGTTLMVSQTDDGDYKAVVLEGSANLAINEGSGKGKKLRLKPGHLAFLPRGSNSFNVVEVDLNRLVSTSKMVQGFNRPLPSLGLIQKEIERQEGEARIESTELSGTGNGLADIDQNALRNMNEEEPEEKVKAPRPPDNGGGYGGYGGEGKRVGAGKVGAKHPRIANVRPGKTK